MASIFEELMSANFALTESAHPVARRAVKVNEHRKINPKNIKVESRKIFEETNYDDLDQQFANEPSEENPDEVVLVIDPEIPSDEEVPENAAEEMIGDLVYKCPICGSNYVCGCDASMDEGIEVDENGVPTECPICGDDAEQILIGEITPAEGAGEEVDPEPVEVEDPEEEEIVDEEIPEEEEIVEEESLNELFGKKKNAPKSSGRFKVIDGQYKNTIQGGFKSRDDAYDWIEDNKDPEDYSKYKVVEESLEEDVEDPVDEVVEEPAMELNVPEEVVEEPDDAPVVEVNNSNVTLMLDDNKFESLMTQIIKENYKGAPQFKITRCSTSKGQLKLEYFVREGRKVTKGVLVGEGFDKTSRKMTIKFVDKGAFTESFAKNPSFIVECVRVRNAVTPLSVKYNYKVKVNESLYRVSGKVGK